MGANDQVRDPLIGVYDLFHRPREQRARPVELGKGPLEAEVVAVEDVAHCHPARMPTREHAVVVEALVESERQVQVERLGLLGADLRLGLCYHVAQLLCCSGGGEELAGSEHLTEEEDAVLLRPSVRTERDLLGGHQVVDLPTWEEALRLGPGSRDRIEVGLARHPELAPGAARTGHRDREQHLAHGATGGVVADVLAAEGLSGPDARAYTALVSGAAAPLVRCGTLDDLAKHLAGRHVAHESNGDIAAGLAPSQPEVRSERGRSAGARAGHRVRPDVACDGAVRRFLGEVWSEALFDTLRPVQPPSFDGPGEGRAQAGGQIDRGVQDRYGHRVQLVRDSGTSVAGRLEWDRTTPGEGVEYDRLVGNVATEGRQAPDQRYRL